MAKLTNDAGNPHIVVVYNSKTSWIQIVELQSRALNNQQVSKPYL